MSQPLSDTQQSIVKSEETLEKGRDNDKKSEKTKVFIDNLKFYYLPLIILIIFGLVIWQGIYPSLQSVVDGVSELDGIKDEVKNKETKIDTLQQLRDNSSQTTTYLEAINNIAPVEKTNVANYQQQIIEIAERNSLTIGGVRSGEEIVTSRERENDPLQLIQVPTSFSLSGGFSNLRSFLSDIYTADDFIVIQEMGLSRVAGVDNWNMDIVFVKYQFAEFGLENTEIDTSEAFLQVPDTARPENSVIDFLEEKYIQDTIDDTTTENDTDIDLDGVS